MGKLLTGEFVRGAVAVAVFVSALIPVSAVTAAQPSAHTQTRAALFSQPDGSADLPVPRPAERRWSDDAAQVSFTPPAGWKLSPATALNPAGEPTFELARFQLQTRDASLYAQPISITTGLVLDAGAVLSIGLAREGTDLVELDLETRVERTLAGRIPGFFVVDEESVYEGLHTLVRYFIARDTGRRLVARAVAQEEDWTLLAPAIRTSLASLRASADAPNGPANPKPAPPPDPAPAATLSIPDPDTEIRFRILANASSMLGTPYVWGGNVAGRGMDCSAYVSRAWGVSRYTTDSIWAVSHLISKDELRPGDAMNLTIGRDPRGRGHIRIFEAWANEVRTLMWVYEETPPRAMRRVIAYDSRYQPIRLNGVAGGGVAPLVIAPPSAIERVVEWVAPAPRPRATARPATARPSRTPGPTARPTPTATLQAVASATPRPSATARPSGTPRPTVRPTRAPTRATPRPTASPSGR